MIKYAIRISCPASFLFVFRRSVQNLLIKLYISQEGPNTDQEESLADEALCLWNERRIATKYFLPPRKALIFPWLRLTELEVLIPNFCLKLESTVLKWTEFLFCPSIINVFYILWFIGLKGNWKSFSDSTYIFDIFTQKFSDSLPYT